VFSIAGLLLLASSALYKYNWFATSEEEVLFARGSIENALQLRSNLFINLVNLTLNQAAMEQETFRYVAEIRAKQGKLMEKTSSDQSIASEIKDMSGSVPQALARLFAVVEQYPDIKTSNSYKELMDKLMDIEKLLHQRRDEYNEKAREFNSATTIFPWKLVANLWDYKRYPYFESDPHKPDTIEIDLTAGSFRRLIPIAQVANKVNPETNIATEVKP
jgi:LemA protein